MSASVERPSAESSPAATEPVGWASSDFDEIRPPSWWLKARPQREDGRHAPPSAAQGDAFDPAVRPGPDEAALRS